MILNILCIKCCYFDGVIFFAALQDPIIRTYLKSRDFESTRDDVETALNSVSKEAFCSLLVTKTLNKSGTYERELDLPVHPFNTYRSVSYT